MMFMEFFVLGSTMPIISLYLKNELGLSGTRIGIIMAVSAVSSLVSPVISACVADRLISAERLLSIMHFISAFMLYGMRSSTGFTPVLLFYFFYWLLIGPTTALTTAITFHHAPHAVKNFGGIRLWGTIGWIAAAWTFRFWFSAPSDPAYAGNLDGALLMGIYGSLLLGASALLIPGRMLPPREPIVLLPPDALRIIKRPQFLIFVLFAVVITLADRMYMYGGGPFLQSLGYRSENIMPVLSIGQMPEIFGLALLGFFIGRFGIRNTLLLGALFEIIRFALFTTNISGFPLYGAISLHGLAYGFFFVTASIHIDRHCDAKSRSGVHQYFALLVGGTGNLVGNIISGFVAEQTGITASADASFTVFWMTALLLSIAGFLGILFTFRDK